jgi:hypothetical protein
MSTFSVATAPTTEYLANEVMLIGETGNAKESISKVLQRQRFTQT